MEDNYKPEIGQMLYGQPYQSYDYSNLLKAALSAISEEWDRVMWNIYQEEVSNPFGNTGVKWKCDEFEIEAYNWDEDTAQPYNFKWKDIEVSWYKYLGRGMSCNKKVSNTKIGVMLDACLNALAEFEKEKLPDLYS